MSFYGKQLKTSFFSFIVAPDDRVAQYINDGECCVRDYKGMNLKTNVKIISEFLLGEDILVAPVLVEGMVSRDIYLPRGEWKDENNGGSHTGPVWLYGYPANLSVLPYFTRSQRSGSVILTSKISSTIIALFALVLCSRRL